MKQLVYIETSVISYLTAWPSRDLIVAANQQVTHDWWRNRRADFELCVSQVVVDEATRGDADAAKARLDALAGISLLRIGDEAQRLADALVERKALPAEASEDALHIAMAAVGGADYLLTWNFGNIANAAMNKQIRTVCRDCGYEPSDPNP